MSTYDSYEPRSNFGLFVFLAFLAAALIGIGSYLFHSQVIHSPNSLLPGPFPVSDPPGLSLLNVAFASSFQTIPALLGTTQTGPINGTSTTPAKTEASPELTPT
ncbi:hypothetical protein OAF28_01515 [Akkermansiaceae bacterium]|nr:hypothetical protein [Akkermansiaceae bacterium]